MVASGVVVHQDVIWKSTCTHTHEYARTHACTHAIWYVGAIRAHVITQIDIAFRYRCARARTRAYACVAFELESHARYTGGPTEAAKYFQIIILDAISYGAELNKRTHSPVTLYAIQNKIEAGIRTQNVTRNSK